MGATRRIIMPTTENPGPYSVPQLAAAFAWWPAADSCAAAFADVRFPTIAAVRTAWGVARAATWARTHRGTVPRPSEWWDGLTSAGLAALAAAADRDGAFPLAPITRAIEADRRSVDRFITADPAGAAGVATYLSLWRGDL